MIIAGYLLTIINYICYCVSRCVKEKRTMLLLDLCAKISTIIALYCLDSITGAISMGITALTLIVISILERKNNSIIRNISFSIFTIIYLLIMVMTFKDISSILVTGTCVATLFANFYLSPQKMRFSGIFISIFYLIYQISIKNIAGCLEIIVFAI